MLTPHPQRVALHDEVHARPYERMTAPLMLTHLALLTATGAASREHLHTLLRARGLPLPRADANHLSIEIGAVRLRWVDNGSEPTERSQRDEPFPSC